MEIQTTLHDFVLKLLVEPGARAEFELDPEGALADAGLGDITAADVQDVIPLVVDYAPVDGVSGLVDTDALVGGLGTDPTSAVSQLQGFTQHLPIGTGSATGTDLNIGATAVAGVSLDLGQLQVSPVTLPGLGIDPVGPVGAVGLAGVPSQLSAIGDPAGTIDGLDPVGSAVGGPVLGGTGPAGLDGLTGTVDGVSGHLGGLTGPVGGVTDPVHGVVDSTVTGVVGAADVTVGTVTGVTGALDSPGLSGSVSGAHSIDGALSADPTAAGHTGSDLPVIGHSPVDGVVGDVTHGVTDHLPLI